MPPHPPSCTILHTRYELHHFKSNGYGSVHSANISKVGQNGPSIQLSFSLFIQYKDAAQWDANKIRPNNVLSMQPCFQDFPLCILQVIKKWMVEMSGNEATQQVHMQITSNIRYTLKHSRFYSNVKANLAESKTIYRELHLQFINIQVFKLAIIGQQVIRYSDISAFHVFLQCSFV